MRLRPCPDCNKLTDHMHDYRPPKMKHSNIIFGKLCYVCKHCPKCFYEENDIVQRYQRHSCEGSTAACGKRTISSWMKADIILEWE